VRLPRDQLETLAEMIRRGEQRPEQRKLIAAETPVTIEVTTASQDPGPAISTARSASDGL
jgi:hypothetical protein